LTQADLSAWTPVSTVHYYYFKPVIECSYEITGLSGDVEEVLDKDRQSKRRLLPNVGGPISCSISLYVNVSFSSRASATYEHAVRREIMQCEEKGS